MAKLSKFQGWVRRWVAACFVLTIVFGNFWIVKLILNDSPGEFVVFGFQIGVLGVFVGGLGMAIGAFGQRFCSKNNG
jgi:hypothetical protein